MSELSSSGTNANYHENFYSDSRYEIDREAERLQGVAAQFANSISKDALVPFLQDGQTVLDVGAGADAHLGLALENDGFDYIAVEPNGELVAMLRQQGIEAHQGDVVNLPVESNSVDAVHMRFLFGWLNQEQRRSALSQAARALRVGEQKAITVIDYDWLMADGPDEYIDAVEVACDILDSFGFDYGYGSRAPSDIANLAQQNVFGNQVNYQILPPVFNEVVRTVEDGLPLLEAAASSLKEGLGAMGDTERVQAIENALDRLRNINQYVEIVLPGVITQTILISKCQPSVETLKDEQEQSLDVCDDIDCLPTSIAEVVEIKPGSSLDSYMRRVQATEYLKNGMLTSRDMITKDGVLCEDSYPKKHLDRSTLFVAVSPGKAKPTAGVRLIRTEASEDQDEVLRSLPTAEYLKLSIADRRIFPEGASASGVFEVSASIRNSEEGGSLLDMSKAIIGLAAEASHRGYHTGLMTTQVKMYNLVKRIMGECNFTLLEGPHKSSIPGASEDIDYVCLSVDMRSFLHGVWEHTKKTKNDRGIPSDINAILEGYFADLRAA